MVQIWRHTKLVSMKNRNFKVILEYFRKRFNSNLSQQQKNDENNQYRINFKGAKPWFYSFGKGNKYNYLKGKNGIYYCCGFTGTGFKFLPLHGKIMYELMKGKDIGFDSTTLNKVLNIPQKAKI